MHIHTVNVITKGWGLAGMGVWVIAAAMGAAVTASATDWSGYERHFNISFPGYTGGTALTDFPVLVKLSSSLNGFDYSKCMNFNGMKVYMANRVKTDKPFMFVLLKPALVILQRSTRGIPAAPPSSGSRSRR